MADSNWSVRIGTRVTDDIQKQLNAMPKKTVQVKAVLDNTGLKTIGTTELTKYEDALGNVVNTSKKFDSTGKELNNTIRSVKSTVDTTSKTLQTASKHTKTLGQDFLDTAGKVAKFGAITAIFGLITSAIGEAIKSVKELDASLTELQKVTDLSGDSLQNYTDQAFSMARDLKSTASDVTDAITEFAKSNYTLEESQVLARQAIIFQTIADGAITASDSATMLIQVMKAYNMTVAESEHIVDAINEVSNKYALSSTDLSNSIGKVASSAKTAGVDFESLLGLMTAGTEVTQNASKTANGLKSILVNLMSDKLSDQFKEFGIDMRDSNGAMKDGYTILQELSAAYNNMELVADETGESLITTNDNMNKLLEDLGGKYNINTLTAILSNFDNAINATESAFNSANSASDEYAVAMDSIAKKTEGLQGAFQELVWGEGGLQGLIKGFLDASTAILKITSDLGGLPVVLMAILSVTTLLKGQMITVGLIKLANFIPTLVTSLKGLQIMYNSATKSIILSNQAINLSIPVIGLVVTAITALTMAWNGYKSAQEEAERATKESISSTISEIESLEQISKQLEDETLTREALYSLIKGTDAYSSEMEDLKDVNELRQEAIDKMKEEQRLKAQQVVDTGLTSYQKALYNQSQDKSDFRYTPYSPVHMQEFFDAIDNASGTQEQIEAISNYKEEVIKLRSEHKEGTFDYKQYTKEISRAEAELSNLYARQKEDNALISDFGNSLTILGKKYDEVTGMVIDLTQAEIDNISKTKESAKTQEEQEDSVSDYEQALKDLDTTLSILSGTTISGLSDAFSLLKDAQEEINNTGKLSIDNYEALMNLGAKYQALLFDENGQLRLNEESITAVYNAKIDEMAITSARNMVNLAGQLSDEGKSFADLANSTNSASVAGWEQVAVMMAELELSEKDSKALQVRIDGIKKWAEEAKKSVGSYNGVAKSASKASSATDKLQSSVKSLLKEHLSDEIDKLKKAEEEEVKVLKNRITLLEKNKDTQLDSIDAQIDGIKKLQDAEESRIDNEISQLKKQKSAIKDYYDAQISALEKANTERERQIKLMQLEEALAKAKSSKVMVMTESGWQYGQDESAVASAEQNLSDYQSELSYTTQIEQLEALKASAIANIDSQIAKWEEYKTTMQNNYASQISALEAYRTTVEQSYATQIEELEANIETIQEQYDLQIEQLETFKDNVDEFVEGLSQAEQTRLANQLNQIKSTASNYETDLNNLKEYVNKFNAILAQKGSAGATVSTGTSIGSSTANSQKARGYASGVASVPSSGIAITGDDPKYSELVVGNKLNGTFTQLERGDRVVNSVDTKNLLGGLLSLGSSMGLNGQTIGATTTNQSNATSQSIQIANITLPSVTNGQGLLDELRGFASGMLQTAYSNV